jgi:hypothetical protein
VIDPLYKAKRNIYIYIIYTLQIFYIKNLGLVQVNKKYFICWTFVFIIIIIIIIIIIDYYYCYYYYYYY